jgi:hypothetical protein
MSPQAPKQGGWGIDPHFYCSIVSFAVSVGDYPPARKKHF